MNRSSALLLGSAAFVVLAGSATTLVLSGRGDGPGPGPGAAAPVCARVNETDRDKAGLADHVAVIGVDKALGETAVDDLRQATAQVRVDQTLKGALPASFAVEQTVERTPAGLLAAGAPDRHPLLPGHRYVVGLNDWRGAAGTVTARTVWFAYPADADRLDAEKARWADAVAHQNPPRADPRCEGEPETP
ncbi:hypothetical protein [Streptomyces sp. NPDC048659]|uniref:hypothetical protein n=1 Tax=Streptomyces sp. NPDC048659 TaxID=3155489 RepID=UPI003414C3BD